MKHFAPGSPCLAQQAHAYLGATAGTASASFSLKGAGSTLAAPVISNVWIPDFQSPTAATRVSYNSVGSGGGITDITGKLVELRRLGRPADVGAGIGLLRRAFRSRGLLSATGRRLQPPEHPEPEPLGQGTRGDLHGTDHQLERPAIKALNKGVSLPSAGDHRGLAQRRLGRQLRVHGVPGRERVRPSSQPVDRAVASTTSAFTVGTGAKGSSGVTAAIPARRARSATSRRSTARLEGAELHGAAIENPSGKFIHPYPQNMADAAALVPARALGRPQHGAGDRELRRDARTTRRRRSRRARRRRS